jgi:DNA-binding transcriptional LysR family regulator
MPEFRRGQLESFVTVVEEGQITRAASRLHIAQPALSQAISQLERELGLQLLERHARGVTPTAAGQIFFEKARVAVSATNDVLETAQTLARAAKAALEVGFLATPPTVHFPELFAAFRQNHPQCAISFRELPFPTDAAASWMKDVDVALCFPPKLESTLEALVLRAEPRLLVARSDHPLAKRRAVAVADVLDETFVGYGPGHDRGWAGLWSLDDHRGQPPDSVTCDRLATPMELIAAISSANAVTAVPGCHAATIVSATSDLAAIPIQDAHPLNYSLVWRKDQRNSAIRALVSTATGFAQAETPELPAQS